MFFEKFLLSSDIAIANVMLWPEKFLDLNINYEDWKFKKTHFSTYTLKLCLNQESAWDGTSSRDCFSEIYRSSSLSDEHIFCIYKSKIF